MPPTKWMTTSHLKYITTYDTGQSGLRYVQTCGRVKQFMAPQSSLLDNCISHGNTCIYKEMINKICTDSLHSGCNMKIINKIII
jgi:hypothetical protein